jgi:transcriptional regulator with XRE-family HTH domain
MNFSIFEDNINTTSMEKTVHQGRNVKRFREMLGFKQDAFATELGEDWNQRKISLLEQKEVIEPEILEQVARVLKVPVKAIEHFDEEKAVNLIANTINNNDNSVTNFAPNCTLNINPVEKWMEALEENKRLYERLLQAEKEKVEILQRVLDSNK